ncbi:MAG: hypothetical protein IJ849_08315 [Selenomonadaceae bacterium]|nr:hypothetical protein [Selenomonadaceae bacterium]
MNVIPQTDSGLIYRAVREGRSPLATSKSAPETGEATGDKVEISAAARALQEKEQQPVVGLGYNVTRQDSANSFRLTFGSSAMLHRIVKQGYLEVEGEQITLTDAIKRELLAKDKELETKRKTVAMGNFLRQSAAEARRSSDAMEDEARKMSRVMQTASRLMHGRKVSPADEKELMEFNPDLYAMAKNSAALAKAREKKHDREDERISAENDAQRAKEAEPRDYSYETEEIPKGEAALDISLDDTAAPSMTVAVAE